MLREGVLSAPEPAGPWPCVRGVLRPHVSRSHPPARLFSTLFLMYFKA